MNPADVVLIRWRRKPCDCCYATVADEPATDAGVAVFIPVIGGDPVRMVVPEDKLTKIGVDPYFITDKDHQ